MSTTTPAGLVPPDVVLVGAVPDGPPPGLFPAEEAVVHGAAAGRRREFGWARAAGREALARFGAGPVAIPRGAGGQPIWPAGFVGSLSHCREVCAAVVARSHGYLAVGVDVEFSAGTPRLLFSIKETVYKAWFTMTGRSLSLRDIAVRLDGGDFSAVVPGRAAALSGRYAEVGGLVWTALAVPAAGREPR